MLVEGNDGREAYRGPVNRYEISNKVRSQPLGFRRRYWVIAPVRRSLRDSKCCGLIRARDQDEIKRTWNQNQIPTIESRAAALRMLTAGRDGLFQTQTQIVPNGVPTQI
jgi:hypothetical protein